MHFERTEEPSALARPAGNSAIRKRAETKQGYKGNTLEEKNPGSEGLGLFDPISNTYEVAVKHGALY